jgi:hypothetical protein
VKKLAALTVANSQASSRPRRAAAIKADERIQQIQYEGPNENCPRAPVEQLIDQIDALHIERKLQFDDDEEHEKLASRPPDHLRQQCIELHDRLACAPNAKLMRYIAECIILLSGDEDPWLVAALIVEMQAIGFRYNALCIYQRKKRFVPPSHRQN